MNYQIRFFKFAIEVHEQSVPGLFESAYHECLFYELKSAGHTDQKENQCQL